MSARTRTSRPFVALRVDQAPVHPRSPLGATRERDVPCLACGRHTWNICARCNGHCGCEKQQ